jgi:hypothetical protein
MLKLDLLSLRQTKRSTDICERLLGEDNGARANCSDLSDELNILDSFREKLQAPAILFEKPQTRTIDLTINQQTNKTFMTKTRSEKQLALCDVKGRFGIAQALIMESRDVFEGRIAHGGMVSIDV